MVYIKNSPENVLWVVILASHQRFTSLDIVPQQEKLLLNLLFIKDLLNSLDRHQNKMKILKAEAESSVWY